MRASMSLAVCGTILLQSGCQSEPVAQKTSFAPSPVSALYHSLSESVSQCDDAAKKSSDVAYRVRTKVAPREQGYAAAGAQTRICNRSAESMVKLGANRLSNDVENVAFSNAAEVCASAALEKASGGDIDNTDIGPSKLAVVSVESGRGNTPDATDTTCAAALANFAKVARISS